MILMPQLSLSCTFPSHLRVCVDFWHPTENFWPLFPSVLLQTNEITSQTFSGSVFACATSCQDEQGTSHAFWALFVLCSTPDCCAVFPVFCGEGPKPLFLNGRICYQLLGKGRNFCLCVKTHSSSCASDRVRVFQSSATLELWRFSFWIKLLKQFPYKDIHRFLGDGNPAWREAEQAPVSTQWKQAVIESVHALWFCPFRPRGIGSGEQALLT